MVPYARPSSPTSSPFMKIFSWVPRPVDALKNAVCTGRSAEQKRPNGAAPPGMGATVLIRSSAPTTASVFLLITHLLTNAPAAPWSRTMPVVAPSSWLTSRVNVLLPLSYAPSPSGMPARRYVPPPSFGYVSSLTGCGAPPAGVYVAVPLPLLAMETTCTPGAAGITYGVCDVLGPAVCATAVADASATAA